MDGAFTIEQLRYVRLGTADLKGASDFAQRILGLQLVDRTEGAAYFRSDFRHHTLVYHSDATASPAIGLEVREPAALERAVEILAAKGIAAIRTSADHCAARRVRQLVSFHMSSGYEIELVVRPLQSGWRYYGPRDAGIVGLEGVALRGRQDLSDQLIWTEVLGGKVSDWIGEAAYISFDQFHHRVALHPSPGQGVLAVEFGVEGIDHIMQNAYHLRGLQVPIVDGPGRRTTSQQMFLTFAGPDGVNFSYVSEGEPIRESRRARQFPRRRDSFCSWNSDTLIPEYK